MTTKHLFKVIIFAKAPVPGKVKTRLIPKLTANQATQVHEQLFSHVMNELTPALIRSIELWVDIDPAHQMFTNWQKKGIEVYQQYGDTLGERLANAFAEVFTRSEKVIAIGSDCPFVDQSYIHQAESALTSSTPCVLGPAQDGGYVLIGLIKYSKKLFSEIAWGSDKVLNQTTKNLKALGWQYHKLPTLWDIDHYEDVERLTKLKPNLLKLTKE